MGFNDIAQEGNWVWSSGEPVTYTNWNTGEPSNTNGEDFGGFNITAAHKWNDFPDWYRMYGIIEVIPEPSSILILGSCVISFAMSKRRCIIYAGTLHV